MSNITFDPATHDIKNPDPWLALALDQSTFFDQSAKDALLRNNGTWSRRVLLPIVRPIARSFIVIFRLIRLFVPEALVSSKALHNTICWGMKNFVSKDANYLILRHFNMGSQVLRFLNDNLADGSLRAHPLLPKSIEDLRDNVFVQHDLNIYNFVIELNTHLKERKSRIKPLPIEDIDFSAIQDFENEIEDLPDKWHNFLDLQTAIELYTPLFALLLSREDFERASNSLQLDETIAVYAATMFNKGEIMGLVNNKHPMVPLSTFEAGLRLMLHGVDAENLYGFIKFVRDHAQDIDNQQNEMRA
ncbi:MAG: hypothetical protein KDJ75_09770 [Alphaproteobacteria bacterium]|nr:hypothetical protein [Alphaproteobacteria bacterium]